MYIKYKFTVTGMTCEYCEEGIKDNLANDVDAYDFYASHTDGIVCFIAHSSIKIGDLIASIVKQSPRIVSTYVIDTIIDWKPDEHTPIESTGYQPKRYRRAP